MKILITRPEPGSSATAARLTALGHIPILAPCLEVQPLPAHLPDSPAALVITSGQAIAGLPGSLHHTPIFCVGDATAARLTAAGFTRVESAGGNARDLYDLVTARRLSGTHVLAVGERHGIELACQLREAGIQVIRRKVYTTRPVRALPAAAISALQARNVSAALFYSAQSVRAFLAFSPPNTGAIVACALSPAVATPLAGLPWKRIRVAAAPTEADMMTLLT